MARIWAELLELDEVGVKDNFFELGGDSLLAVRMILQIEEITHQAVSQNYFRTPTSAALARLCTPGSAQAEPVPLPAVSQTESATGRSRRQWVRLVTGQPCIANRLFAEERNLFLSLAQDLNHPAA